MGVFRTILRRTFYTAAAVSTLLLLATLIAWPVSHYRRVDAQYVFTGGDHYSLSAGGGRVVVGNG